MGAPGACGTDTAGPRRRGRGAEEEGPGAAERRGQTGFGPKGLSPPEKSRRASRRPLSLFLPPDQPRWSAPPTRVDPQDGAGFREVGLEAGLEAGDEGDRLKGRRSLPFVLLC